jgi:hypothetical protein
VAPVWQQCRGCLRETEEARPLDAPAEQQGASRAAAGWLLNAVKLLAGGWNAGAAGFNSSGGDGWCWLAGICVSVWRQRRHQRSTGQHAGMQHMCSDGKTPPDLV